MNAPPTQLLDSSHVDLASGMRETVCVDTEESCLSRIDTAFRILGAYRVTKVSINRVPPTEEEMDAQEHAGLL